MRGWCCPHSVQRPTPLMLRPEAGQDPWHQDPPQLPPGPLPTPLLAPSQCPLPCSCVPAGQDPRHQDYQCGAAAGAGGGAESPGVGGHWGRGGGGSALLPPLLLEEELKALGWVELWLLGLLPPPALLLLLLCCPAAAPAPPLAGVAGATAPSIGPMLLLLAHTAWPASCRAPSPGPTRWW